MSVEVESFGDDIPYIWVYLQIFQLQFVGHTDLGLRWLTVSSLEKHSSYCNGPTEREVAGSQHVHVYMYMLLREGCVAMRCPQSASEAVKVGLCCHGMPIVAVPDPMLGEMLINTCMHPCRKAVQPLG